MPTGQQQPARGGGVLAGLEQVVGDRSRRAPRRGRCPPRRPASSARPASGTGVVAGAAGRRRRRRAAARGGRRTRGCDRRSTSVAGAPPRAPAAAGRRPGRPRPSPTTGAASAPRRSTARSQNTRPITLARSTTSRSCGSSESSRACSTPRSVPGTVRVATTSSSTVQPPLPVRTAPWSISQATSSSMKNGLPSLASTTSRRTWSGTCAARCSTSATRSPLSRRDSGRSRTVRCPGSPSPHCGRRSSSAGRVLATTSTGKPCGEAADSCSQSRLAASAQCRSSSSRTTGAVAASRRSRSPSALRARRCRPCGSLRQASSWGRSPTPKPSQVAITSASTSWVGGTGHRAPRRPTTSP